MELQDLFNSTAVVPVTYKNLTFKLHVFTEKLTPAYKAQALLMAATSQAEAESGAENTEAKDETAMMVADLIESWTDGDDNPVLLKGEVFAPVYENLVELSYPLLSTFMRCITTYLGELSNPQNATN